MRKTSQLFIALLCATWVLAGTAHAQRFKNNNDGTVTDTKTGLQWEMKTGTIGTPNPSDVHDVNNTYTISTDDLADGTAFTNFLATLNNGASVDGKLKTAITGCFAKRCDWRLPTIVELQGIIDLNVPTCGTGKIGPCIRPVFGPTQGNTPNFGFYWATTTVTAAVDDGWGVGFKTGQVGNLGKSIPVFVRAVRTKRPPAGQ